MSGANVAMSGGILVIPDPGPEARAAACRVVAANSRDAQDLTVLLRMLGLAP